MPRRHQERSSVPRTEQPDPFDFIPVEDDFLLHDENQNSTLDCIWTSLSVVAHISIIIAMSLYIFGCAYEFTQNSNNQKSKSKIDPEYSSKSDLHRSQPTIETLMSYQSIERNRTESVCKEEFGSKVDEEQNKFAEELARKIKELEVQIEEINQKFENNSEWKSCVESKMEELSQYNLTNSYTSISKNFEEMINNAISVYDADKIGKMDYALESAGGSVVSTPNTIPYPSKIAYEVLGLITLHYPSNPRTLIQAGNLPGECFAFHGQSAKIIIKLSDKIDIKEVSLEHSSLPNDKGSAPKDFKVFGLEDESGPEKLLGSFQYDINDKPLQIFEIKTDKEKNIFTFIMLQINSNHGNPSYTCVYRFRVHGDPQKDDEVD